MVAIPAGAFMMGSDKIDTDGIGVVPPGPEKHPVDIVIWYDAQPFFRWA